jgi:hypothetical protein
MLACQRDLNCVWFEDAAVSPEEDLVAAVVWTDTDNPVGTLVVEMLGETREILREENVLEFSWSPDGHRIAFVKGERVGNGLGVRANEVFVVEIASGERWRALGPSRNIAWGCQDGDELFGRDWTTGEIWRANVRTKTVTATEYKGLGFAPGAMGLYYREPSHDIGVQVFDDNHRDVTRTHAALDSAWNNLIPVGWYDETKLVVETGKLDNRVYLLDFSSGQTYLFDQTTGLSRVAVLAPGSVVWTNRNGEWARAEAPSANPVEAAELRDFLRD